jgi:hypothetical protein
MGDKVYLLVMYVDDILVVIELGGWRNYMKEDT